MTILLIGLHVLVCLFLIFVVLLQSAQAADLAGAFGGGGSQTALGMRGATTMLHKATTVAAVLFMVTSLGLGLVGRSESSLIEGLDDPNSPAVMTPEGAAGDESGEQGDEEQGDVQGAGEQQGEAGDDAARQQAGAESGASTEGAEQDAGDR